MKKHSDDNSSNPNATVQSYPSSRARWTYDVHHDPPIRQVPEFIMLGYDELRSASPLHEHEHPGCYEFVLIERGQASWELEGVLYRSQAGDLFHSCPGEKHRGGFNAIEPCKFWWLIVAVPKSQGWLRLSSEECMLMHHMMEKLPRVNPVGLSPIESFKKLRKALLNQTPEQSIAVRNALTDILLAFLQPGIGNSTIALDLLRQYDILIAKMSNEPEWRPSIDELASFSGVSSSHFYRTFQEYTGEAPITFSERLRVKEACRQLAETADSVTDISHRLGYQSSQHFATVFKRFVGATPSQWRNDKKTLRLNGEIGSGPIT